ncbi:hypothetical protein KCP70_05870 [Salmonella enterica subsp. enterica]|nr:hypothetical protein KCP70_05870 [Salmonella enterica subsp. enterica]
MPPSEAPSFRSLCYPSPAAQTGAADVLVAFGSVVLTVGAVTGPVTTIPAGLLFGNILLALCSPEPSEYVIVGWRRNCNGGLVQTSGHNSCCAASALRIAFPASNWRAGCVTTLQSLSLHSGYTGQKYCFSQIAEIALVIKSDKKRITLFTV